MKIGITSVQGNILSSACQTVVCTVNCVGVMGKGVALDFKDNVPGLFAYYKRLCNKRLLSPGGVFLYNVPGTPNKQVLGVATKDHWRYNSQMSWIEEILKTIYKDWRSMNIQSLALPPLGCGNGGLKWEEVRPMVLHYLGELPIPIELFEPEQHVITRYH